MILQDWVGCGFYRCDNTKAHYYEDDEVIVVSCDECCNAAHTWKSLNDLDHEMMLATYPDGYTCDHCGDEFYGFVGYVPECGGTTCGYCIKSREWEDVHEACNCNCTPGLDSPLLESLAKKQYGP